MKFMKRLVVMFLLLLPMAAWGQEPLWVDDSWRGNNFPQNKYLVGFATSIGNNSSAFAADLTASAKSQLIEGILVSVKSAKSLSKSESNGIIREDYAALTLSFADAEINGMKQEYHYNANTRTGYAFAYADRADVCRYYNALLLNSINEIEVGMESAAHFEKLGNRARARKIYGELKDSPVFMDMEISRSILIALTYDISSYKTPSDYSYIIDRAISHLEGSISVFVHSDETNFGRPVNLLAPKLKALLSEHGCSFTDNRAVADWVLQISASTREGSEVDGVYFSYLDADVSLKNREGREIYNNCFSDMKGGGIDYSRAGIKAYDACLKRISEEIVKNIEK